MLVFPPIPGSPQRRGRIQAEHYHHTSRCKTVTWALTPGGRNAYCLGSCARLCTNICIFKVSLYYKLHICLCSSESTRHSQPKFIRRIESIIETPALIKVPVAQWQLMSALLLWDERISIIQSWKQGKKLPVKEWNTKADMELVSETTPLLQPHRLSAQQLSADIFTTL